jgi:hypothetical protein
VGRFPEIGVRGAQKQIGVQVKRLGIAEAISQVQSLELPPCCAQKRRMADQAS